MVRIIFLGRPVPAKGRKLAFFASDSAWEQISTGDLLRRNCVEQTELGRQAEGYMARGELVPDGLVIAMIERELRRLPTGFVMDGFPRNVVQAEALDALLARADGRSMPRFSSPPTGRRSSAVSRRVGRIRATVGRTTF